jgi:cell division transport system permease protein
MSTAAKPGYLYPIVGTALVLFVLGIFLLLTLHTRTFVRTIKENVDVWVEMHQGATPDDAAILITRISASPHVVPASVRWMSHEDAAALIKKELGDENLLEDLPNVMRDVVQFNIKADKLNAEDMLAFQEEMKSDSLVSELFFETTNADQITSNLDKMSRIALILALLLVAVSVVLIHNTVRLALFTNRLLVKNMQIVGATHGFVRAPYLWRAVYNGLWSALIAIGLLIGSFFLLNRYMKGTEEIGANWSVFATFALLLVLGVVISFFSTWFTLNKYLNARVEDLY